ncbi:MAG TPA: hypothetical protein VIK48_02515, partial [Candidatus Manganitrophaceae bacterium]
AGKTAAFHLLSSLLLNTPLDVVSFSENQPAQAAVIFQTKDGALYRITADFLKKMIHLSKLDASGKGTIIEKEPEKIREWRRRTITPLEEEALGACFMIDRPKLAAALFPSNGGGTISLPAPGAATPAFPRADVSTPSKSGRSEKESELQDLRKKLEELGQYEGEILNLHDKASETKHRIEESRSAEMELKLLEEAEHKKFSGLVGADEVSLDLMKQYEDQIKIREEEEIQLRDELEEAERRLARIGGVDPVQDRLIQIGVGLTVFSFLLPILITLRNLFSYLFLFGTLAGIGLSSYGYFILNQRASQKKSLEKTRSGLNDKLFQLGKKFDKEFKGLTELMKKTGSKDIPDLKALQRAYREHLQNKTEWTEKKQALLNGATVEALELQLQELAQNSKALEEKLRDYEGLNAEAYRLQEELRMSNETESEEISLFETSFSPAVSNHPAGASFFAKVLSNGGLNGLSLRRDQVQKVANIFYSMFSAGKKEEIRFDPSGKVEVGGDAPDHLSSGVADQVSLSILLAILDQAPDVPFPLILDDPLLHLDPKGRQAALEILQGVSKKRQVVLFTCNSYSSLNGAHQVQLGAS